MDEPRQQTLYGPRPRRAAVRIVLAAVVVGLGLLVASATGCGGAAEPSGEDGPEASIRRSRLVESAEELDAALADPSVTPFTEVATQALQRGFQLTNFRPAVVVFDYDRDGDLDLFITSEAAYPNYLHRNDGSGSFVNVAAEAGVAAVENNSSGAVACDLNNDGYQDLYVGARGLIEDRLDFRSALGTDDAARALREAIKDRLFVNNRDGTFTDITDSAIVGAPNLRSAGSVACADVDGDGWLDIYVGNLVDEDFFIFNKPHHPGHYNLLYRNNGDLTFEEIAAAAGVQGPENFMRDPQDEPMVFEDPATGKEYEGYDPTVRDANGNRVADPTGRTHAVLFFDYDDDGDPDLWVANDGDRLRVFRNDSSPGSVRFTPVERAMGIDKVGNWMGFAVGDYDGDADLDVFVTNIGYHLRMREPQQQPGGDCKYSERFIWGTCLNFLLRNDGPSDVPGLGRVGRFPNVALSTTVSPSPLMPPLSLDPANIHPAWEVPTGLGAYDFGYGTTFFDFDNDGDQDLYWLGSEINSGDGPGGEVYRSAGRMLRGDGQGSFEDITVRAHLLDIISVDYSAREPDDIRNNLVNRKFNTRFHENGKGLAHGDLNGDGYVDLVGTNSSGTVWRGSMESIIPAKGPVFVWINGGGENHWVTLRLRGRMGIDGTGSNADAVGARVYVKTARDGDEEPLVQVQEVIAGSSYISMDSLDLEFGVGKAQKVSEVTILWPSGRRQVLENIQVDHVIEIIEPEE